MHRIDGEGATPDGRFTEGNPIAGEIPTVVTKGWLNDVQENIMRCLREGGIPATKGRDLDLWDAIMAGATKIVTDILQSFEYVQDGGNVTGTIKGGKFRLNAPAGPTIPASLTPSGGNVTGTINVLAGTFTLTAAGGGSGGEGPAIPDGILAIGSGTGLRAAQGGGKQASWNNGELGVSGVISCGNGYIRSSVYEGQPLAGSGNGLFHATIYGDPSPDHNFYVAASNSVPANPGGVRKFAVDMTGSIFASNASIGAADYAEWFEGQPDIGVGMTVVLGAEGVRCFDAARDRPSHIIGVTRPRETRAALIGNAAEAHWARQYLTDDFGAPIWEDAVTDTGEPYRRWALNPAFDPSRPYVPRSQRAEWSLVGLLGQIPVRAGQTVNPRWRLIGALSDTVNLYFVR